MANDPVAASGQEGLSAYYATIWSHPNLLLATGGFAEFAEEQVSGKHETVIHVVSRIGVKEPCPLPAYFKPGDKIFFDGLSETPLHAAAENAPKYHTISSLKERLTTPAGDFLIPQGLPMGVWTDIPEGWSGTGNRDGSPFYLYSGDCFLSPVSSPYVDFLLRRDKGRGAWNWRYFLAISLARWLGADEEPVVLDHCRERDLRDAFPAYGFHRWVVARTALKLDDTPELSTADAAVLEAAEAFSKAKWDRTEKLLQAGYHSLKSRLDELSGANLRYFAEGHHGGMLHSDIGFYEHDWPQMVCDILREYMSFPGVVVSLDMPASVYRHYLRRFPSFYRELCRWIQEGRIELLNGMYGQPLSDCHSLENLLTQFLVGRKEMNNLFGSSPAIFAMEEYSLGPAMPQILDAVGIEEAVHAVRLGGTSKTNSPGVRTWRGIGHGAVRAIEHPDTGTPGLSTKYFLQLPEAFSQARRQGRDILPLFNIPDFGWNILFRDEIFTGLRFGPVLFEMVTFQELFDLLPPSNEPVNGDWEDTYHTIFTQYTVRGNMRQYFEKLRQMETMLVAADLCARFSGKRDPAFTEAWQDYLLGSSHDYTLVGAGLNGWYSSATKATYQGPVQATYLRTLESIMSAKFETWTGQAQHELSADSGGPYLTNLHGFRVPVRLADRDQSDITYLEPFSSIKAPSMGAVRNETSCKMGADEAVLQGEKARFAISRESGAITSAQWHGHTLWTDNDLGLLLGHNRLQVSDGAFSHPLVGEDGASVRHRGRLSNDGGVTVGWLETSYQMHGDDLLVEHVFCPASLPERGDFDWDREWRGTFRCALPRASQSEHVWVCQANAMVRVSPGARDPGLMEAVVPDAKAHVTSPEVIGWETREGCPVWYYNAGFPAYLVYDNRIEQFLLQPGEGHLRLRFGIGFGHNQYSPVQRSRMLFQPPLRTRRAMPKLPIRWDNPRIGLLCAEANTGADVCKLWLWNYGNNQELFKPETPPAYRMDKIVSAPGNLTAAADETCWQVGPFSLFSVELQHVKAGRKLKPSPAPSAEILSVK